MRGAVRVGAVCACVLGLAVPAFGAGEVGDPPSMSFDMCDRDLRPCTDAVILAAGRHGAERIEVWGMGSRLGLCTGFDTIRATSGTSAYGCGGHGRPASGEALKIDYFGGRTKGAGTTQVAGRVRRDVRRVTVRYRRGGTMKRTSTIFNQVSAPLARRIDERPFGVFAATLRGCMNPKRIRVVAFGDGGRILQKERGPGRFEICGRGSTGLFPLGASLRVREQRSLR